MKFARGPGIRQGGDFVEIQSETFYPCIGFISDKYRVSEELLKMGNTTLLYSSSNYTKRHINVCSRGDLCFPFLSNFSETLCVKIGFDVRISFVSCMNGGRFPEGGRFHILLSSWTLLLLAGNSLVVIQKARLLDMNI